MNSETTVNELLERWEEALNSGNPISSDVLCQNHPELFQPLQQQIAKLQAINKNLNLETIALASVSPTLKMPSQIDNYQLLHELGEGGMGQVWLAEQIEPVQRKVAIKIIKAGRESRDVVSRFHAEQQALAMMDYQNIAKVFDAGSTENRPNQSQLDWHRRTDEPNHPRPTEY